MSQDKRVMHLPRCLGSEKHRDLMRSLYKIYAESIGKITRERVQSLFVILDEWEQVVVKRNEHNQKRLALKYNKPYTAYCENCKASSEFSALKKCEKCKKIDVNHQ